MRGAGVRGAGVFEWDDGNGDVELVGGRRGLGGQSKMFGLAGADDERTTAARAEAFEIFTGEQKGVTTVFKINARGMAVRLEAKRILNDVVIKIHGIVL